VVRSWMRAVAVAIAGLILSCLTVRVMVDQFMNQRCQCASKMPLCGQMNRCVKQVKRDAKSDEQTAPPTRPGRRAARSVFAVNSHSFRCANTAHCRQSRSQMWSHPPRSGHCRAKTGEAFERLIKPHNQFVKSSREKASLATKRHHRMGLRRSTRWQPAGEHGHSR
jgi:hypothetical protein